MPYLLVVYDVNVKRVQKVHNLLKQYLHWRQNSVFVGNLTEFRLKELKANIKQIINTKQDYVIIYSVKSEKNLTRHEFGKSKEKEFSFII